MVKPLIIPLATALMCAGCVDPIAEIDEDQEVIILERTGADDDQIATVCSQFYRALALHQPETIVGHEARQKSERLHGIFQRIGEPDRVEEINAWFAEPMLNKDVVEISGYFDDPDWRNEFEAECDAIERRYGRE